MMPVRVQRKRTKGWKMPPGTVYVGRPTRYGNPFADAQKFKLWMDGVLEIGIAEARIHKRPTQCDIEALRGKNLACWCALDQPCHADVLLELANASCAK